MGSPAGRIVDPEVFSATIDRFTRDPETARSAPAVAARVVDGRAELSAGLATWHADLPAVLGGTNAAPSPTAYLLGALAGCADTFLRGTLAPQLGSGLNRQRGRPMHVRSAAVDQPATRS